MIPMSNELNICINSHARGKRDKCLLNVRRGVVKCCVYSHCACRFQKSTETKEETTREKVSHLLDVAIVISRPSSRDATAADIEVQVTTIYMTSVYLFPLYEAPITFAYICIAMGLWKLLAYQCVTHRSMSNYLHNMVRIGYYSK